MKISGFTFIKDALINDYPIVEAIQSILPVCDEFIVAVGKSIDETLDLIKHIDPAKIKIIETVWDDNLRKGGKVLAVETNKAFENISPDSDWAFYIQGDEVVHEKYLDGIYKNMQQYLDNPQVDGFLFKYLHFYGSYDYVGASAKWYKNEIRIIRNDKKIYSYRDAQGFRKGNNEKLNVIPLDAFIYHYGWVKDPRAMQNKQEAFHKLWHNDAWLKEHISQSEIFDYHKNVSELKLFHGAHPKVMQERIESKNWKFDVDISINRKTLKDKLKEFASSRLGLHFDYRNYKILKR